MTIDINYENRMTADTSANRIAAEAAACKRRIDLIVVHCTATPAGRDVSAAEIRRGHVRERGFSDIGYHYVVRIDGAIESGRRLDRAGAHCEGRNAHSIGVCYVGGVDSGGRPSDTRTEAQKKSLMALLVALRKAFPRAKIRGHRDFANKACPCFDATAEYVGV